MELGIAVDCWGGRGEIYERAQRLHDKMQTNLSMARDRLHFLGMLSMFATITNMIPNLQASNLHASHLITISIRTKAHRCQQEGRQSFDK